MALRPHQQEERILHAVDACRDEMVQLAQELIRIPSVNPPGAHYADCAALLGQRLSALGCDVTSVVAHDHPDHTERYPRQNVLGRLAGTTRRPTLHLNGHVDVVPAGRGWTRDPFGAAIEGDRLYGRGSSDMKGGLAAAVFALAALRRAGSPLAGTLEVSGTVDEESGGFAGAAYLARHGLLSAPAVDYVIIPEPRSARHIGIGHKGLYWCVVTAYGQGAHGAMPYRGVSAIDHMAALIDEINRTLVPALARRRSAAPVLPVESRVGTINCNAIRGGQYDTEPQTPNVADWCEAIFDRRYILEDGAGADGVERIKTELQEVIDRVCARRPGCRFSVRDYGNTVYPTHTPPTAVLVRTLAQTIRDVLGVEPALVSSPGTYDHKHVTHIGGITECVAYGPGAVEQAHQPDEWCRITAMLEACRVMAITAWRLLGQTRA